MSLTLEQAKIVYDGLKVGYKAVESRMQFGRKQRQFLDEDICQHLIGYKLPKEIQTGVTMYDSINSETKLLIDPLIGRVLEIIQKETLSVEQIFLIMSTNWCGKSRHVKHVHTLLQKDPQRCMTLSFPIPIYIDSDEPETHKFHWYYQPDIFPKITYTSHIRMERLAVEYSAVDIPKTKTMSLLFDSARVPHWINNTRHLYLWVVCDAVTFRDFKTYPGLKLNLHDGVL